MLPTLVFILWAYGMYALISAMSKRKGAYLRARNPWRRYGWLGVLAGAGLGLGLAVVMAQSFDDQDHNLKLAGFLGTVWAEGPDKVDRRVEDPPIKSAGAGDRPAYALLHPGTSPAELAQEKTAAKPRPARKPKLRRAPNPQVKGTKTVAQAPKKDKVAAKSKVAKKKKPASPPAASNKKSAAG